MLKRSFNLMLVACTACLGFSQAVPSPKRELRHDPNNLVQRYEMLKCALVVIQSGNKIGTGFYVNPSGDVVTALHVLGDRTIQELGAQQFKINLLSPTAITIKNSNEEQVTLAMTGPLTALDSSNGDAWGADLAIVKTGKPVSCWLKPGKDEAAKPGQHVIAMGFPGLAFGSLSLYTGIISARLKSDLLIGTTVSGQPLKATNDFLRVQMPISPGISGAPVIDDKDEVIAVVTSAGASSHDLDVLIQLGRTPGAFGPTPPPNTLVLPSVVAQFAGIVHDYFSPGYGDSVPLSYLTKKAPPPNQQPVSPSH